MLAGILIGTLMCTTVIPSARAGQSQDNQPTIIPRPANVQPMQGALTFSGEIKIYTDPDNPEALAVAQYFAQCLKDQTGLPCSIADESRAITADFLLMPGVKPELGEEGYELVVTPLKVLLQAPTPRGLFLGVQTIRQLLQKHERTPGSWQLACVRVKDQPRYPWRGMLLDCGRHFMDKEFVKRYIDLLAYHKMNVLHWHMTEDQGWRIEIKKYPKLTEIGAWRKATRDSEQPRDAQGRYGGYYSQKDIKEIVDYAASRYITVVPEIELPGHSCAALAAYPEISCTGGPFEVETRWGVHPEVYCAGNDKTFEFLEDVLTEVIELFPSYYIHIGGDECPKQRWEACPKCQARIKAEGLKNEHELQSYFVRRIEKFLNSKGRRLVGWDEILEGGLAPNATVQSWRGMKGAIAAATTGHDVISSPTSNCYLDYAQARLPGEPIWMGYVDLKTCYAFEPTPAQLTAEQAQHVLGLEGNMWTEHAAQNRIDWQVFPRLCALAEVGWSPKVLRDWENFKTRLAAHYGRLDDLGVSYFIPVPKLVQGKTVFTDSTEAVFENYFTNGAIYYTLDGGDPDTDSRKYAEPLKLSQTTTVKLRAALENGRLSNVAEFNFRRLRPLEPVEVAEAEPGVSYAYYEGSFEKLPDFSKLKPVKTGVVETINLSPRKSDERFAMTYEGYLEVATEGVYTFYLISDDGSRLSVGGEVVVDHDGLHGASEKNAQIILKAGKHRIHAEFFQAGGAQRLEVGYEGPELKKQPLPAAALSH